MFISDAQKKIYSFYHPTHFQGWGKQKKYFEGWYFKVLNKDASKAFAFIPGIAMNEKGDKHAFVQVLDGKLKTSQYHRFLADQFTPFVGSFSIRIAEHLFENDHISFEWEGCKVNLSFENQVPWPSSFLSPGIMGPFSYVPFMECYHGIVSMNHTVNGTIQINGELIDMSGGKGYIEKDWGRSFPSAYIWMQSNHFSNPDVSFKCSVAKIPWLRNSFVGFIAGLWVDNRLIQFTTYNGTKLLQCQYKDHVVELIFENKQHLLEVRANKDATTPLAAPILGLMEGRIEESMTSEIYLRLIEKKTGRIIFEDKGLHTALEVAGAVKELEK